MFFGIISHHFHERGFFRIFIPISIILDIREKATFPATIRSEKLNDRPS